MIVTEKDSWLRMIFAIHGTTMDRIWPRFAVVVGFSIFTTAIALVFPAHAYTLTMAPFTIVGLALAIFLGFRNNAAYDRYWEGRKLWGRMVNVCRTFTMQINTLIGDENSTSVSAAPAQDQRRMVLLIIAYINALRHRLRDTDASVEIRQRLEDTEEAESCLAQDNVPAAIADRISRCINNAWRGERLNVFHLPLLHQNLTEMLAIQGGCERIKSTPIPFTYSVLTHRTVLLYCLALPCGLHDTVGILTPVVVALVAYAFLGLDAVGDEIEQPFSIDDNDLPLLQLTTMIEINVRQLSGHPAHEIPPPIEPVDHLLI
ncbi:bestrophin family protein [Blastopirellula marina]|uniref:Putative transmembrane protein yneE n=1 Tax=Blastopirellula marina DSM 3645 TaxID=314230 RepID=A3ZNK3_9BACT|nr:bestrophin family protein [Blastopirellula marina]EAQ81898.1 putative transmembrane protein yneE [Blastopirellula marina DSM 3645]